MRIAIPATIVDAPIPRVRPHRPHRRRVCAVRTFSFVPSRACVRVAHCRIARARRPSSSCGADASSSSSASSRWMTTKHARDASQNTQNQYSTYFMCYRRVIRVSRVTHARVTVDARDGRASVCTVDVRTRDVIRGSSLVSLVWVYIL